MADQTERLLLQVDAATELLRRNLADGEKPLDRFEKRAAKMAENVEGSIGSMGKRFGAFADLAQDAATKAEGLSRRALATSRSWQRERSSRLPSPAASTSAPRTRARRPRRRSNRRLPRA